MIKTNLTGVYFRETQTNNKPDKTYYITYKDNLNKKIWLKIGNYSQGIREAYCNQKRNEILTKQRNGEEPPIILQKKKRTILSIETLATEYFKGKNINGSTFNHYNVHILPYFIKQDIDLLDKKEIEKFRFFLEQKVTINTKKPLAPKTINNRATCKFNPHQVANFSL